jgi:hypothetical protein
MKVLLAGEESQIITEAFIKRGHDAMSCDIAYPGAKGLPHYQGDVRDLLDEYFDLVIFHPVCKFIANSGVRWLHTEAGRVAKMIQACEFFNLRNRFNSPRVGTENPIPHGYASVGYVIKDGIKKEIPHSNLIGLPDQIIQPWQFGHKQMKATCFWLKGLPPLIPTDIVGPPPKDKKERYKWQNCWTASPGPERERERSRTFPGIAEAIADQWGNLK